MSTFHLWLVPRGAACERLAGVIAELSALYGSPKFAPHLTILGNLEGEEQSLADVTKQVAHVLHPFDVRLKEPSYTSRYFQCLFLPVEPSLPVLEAHQRARQVFGRKSRRSFYPHVSLLYGLFPARMKQDIIKSLPTDLPSTLLVSQLQLIRADSTNPKDWQVVEILDV